jgi:hypothetical protein
MMSVRDVGCVKKLHCPSVSLDRLATSKKSITSPFFLLDFYKKQAGQAGLIFLLPTKS